MSRKDSMRVDTLTAIMSTLTQIIVEGMKGIVSTRIIKLTSI